ncbi:MAG: DEAD/DEAH box helicase [Bacteroidaceae bacterium]|nr:DEAD/DEAH box helicase [Bacteroidaceae bacterium]
MTYNLSKLGVTDLNVMQQEMLQVCRRERQIVLLGPTGSGKTLAYLLPLLETVSEKDDSLQVVILVPSRELAMQTCDVLKLLTTSIRCMACYGGRPAMDEHRILRNVNPQVLIATPGRMLDHLQKENIQVEQVKTLVIDEFDKCLELGFQQQMSLIISRLPSVERRILLSATDNPRIPDFVGTKSFHKLSYLDESEQIPDRIRLFEMHSPMKDKLESLYQLLCVLGQQTSLVFVNYRESVERVGEYLHRMGISADMFHGGMEQRDRERALYRFCNGSCNVLVSTDLASRGLDIPSIDNIIHYHLPLDEEAYIHRNGRTARWDAEGASYMILGPEEHRPEYINDEPQLFQIPQRIPHPAEPRWITLYIGKGKKDKVNKVDIVGFLSKIGGLERNQLGRIDVLPNWSFVAVDRKIVNTLLARIKGQKIKGIKTIFSVAE